MLFFDCFFWLRQELKVSRYCVSVRPSVMDIMLRKALKEKQQASISMPARYFLVVLCNI